MKKTKMGWVGMECGGVGWDGMGWVGVNAPVNATETAPANVTHLAACQ